MQNGQIHLDETPLAIVTYPLESLISAEYNPRQLTVAQYDDLMESIKRFGFVDPVIINKHPERENIVIGGHQRLRIAKALGISDIPCVEVELGIEEEKELNVRLNKNTGGWDWDALANEFSIGNLTKWGFTERELEINWDDMVPLELSGEFDPSKPHQIHKCPKCGFKFSGDPTDEGEDT
tara:strand:+ start:653 stop:1192 length:540 start_codon:yes stop_codon:yes gene_type:complete